MEVNTSRYIAKKYALSKSAITSIFPNCPSYLSDTKETKKRISRERKEVSLIETAMKLSREERATTKAKFSI